MPTPGVSTGNCGRETGEHDGTRRGFVCALVGVGVRGRSQACVTRHDRPASRAGVASRRSRTGCSRRGRRGSPSPPRRRRRAASARACDVADDRVVALLHVARADLVAHVERFELLDGVRARTHPQRAAHHRVEIDEDAVAQQLVDVRLAHAVPRGHRQQVRGLVGRVVVDVHVRDTAAAAGSRCRGRSRARASPRRTSAPTARVYCSFSSTQPKR